MRKIILIFILFFSLSVQAQNYGALDRRAKNAPEKVALTQKNLVDYLTENLRKDSEKARVLAAWIAYQVQRDGYRRKVLIQYSNQNRTAPKPLNNDTFVTRIGTPQDFARLYQQLGTLAGLEVAVIEGYVGDDISAFRYSDPAFQAIEVLTNNWLYNNKSLQRYRAEWNAVKIGQEWHLVDTYQMIANPNLFEAQSVQSDMAMERFLHKRQIQRPKSSVLISGKYINDDYFFARPSQFVKTHFPFDSKWQLLPTPWTWAVFTDQ